MPATFTVDAFTGEHFRGKVRQIRNAPTTLQNVVTYTAVIDVANPDLKLKPGMTANVTVVAAERDDVLTVPNTPRRFRPDSAAAPRPQATSRGQRASQAPTVWKIQNSKLVPVQIQT